MAKRDILADAIADAKRVKSAAFANAKLALEETFQPTLQRMISSRIAEEDGEEEMDDFGGEDEFGGGEIDIDINAAPEAEAPEVGFGGEEEAPAPEGEEGGEDLELEALIRELDGEEEFDLEEGEEFEDDFQMDEEDEFELEEGEEDWQDPIPDEPTGSVNEEDEFMDDELTEALNALLGEEEGLGDDLDMGPNKEDGSVYTDHSLPSGPQFLENRKLRNENKKLKKDLNEAYRAVTTLKTTLNEVNLLNGKLMYTTKTFKKFNLNESQQARILDSFDRANSIREVKLVYSTICESFNKKPLTKRVTEGFASKSVNAISPSRKPSNKDKDIVSESMVSRMQRLAGLKKLED